jgi:hypothetical protein
MPVADGCPPSLPDQCGGWSLPALDGFPPTHRFYSDTDINLIIKTTGLLLPKTISHYGGFYMSESGITCVQEEQEPISVDGRRALAFSLEDVVRRYIALRQLDDFPSTLECRNKYAQIGSACERLLDSIHDTSAILNIDIITGGTSETPHAFIVDNDAARPPRPNFQRCVVELKNLLNWANWCCDGLGKNLKRNKHGGVRQKHASSFDHWMCCLTEIYVWVFDERPGLTRNTSRPGPFLRYLDACVRPVLGDDTPSAEGFRSRFLKLQNSGLIKS